MQSQTISQPPSPIVLLPSWSSDYPKLYRATSTQPIKQEEVFAASSLIDNWDEAVVYASWTDQEKAARRRVVDVARICDLKKPDDNKLFAFPRPTDPRDFCGPEYALSLSCIAVGSPISPTLMITRTDARRLISLIVQQPSQALGEQGRMTTLKKQSLNNALYPNWMKQRIGQFLTTEQLHAARTLVTGFVDPSPVERKNESGTTTLLEWKIATKLITRIIKTKFTKSPVLPTPAPSPPPPATTSLSWIDEHLTQIAPDYSYLASVSAMLEQPANPVLSTSPSGTSFFDMPAVGSSAPNGAELCSLFVHSLGRDFEQSPPSGAPPFTQLPTPPTTPTHIMPQGRAVDSAAGPSQPGAHRTHPRRQHARATPYSTQGRPTRPVITEVASFDFSDYLNFNV